MVIHHPTGWTAHITPRSLIAVVSCVAMLAMACTGGGGLEAGDAASLDESSTAEMSVGDGPWTLLQGGQTVPAGARVRATADEARLLFREGTARLAPGATALVEQEALELQRGEVLVDSDGGLSVVNADTEISGDATVRVSTGLSSRVAVYRGKVAVRRPAQDREVPTLRQLELSDFRLAADGEPLRYRDGDVWDQELLAEAIAFDGEAARLARGIDVEFGTEPQPRQFYASFTEGAVVPLLRDTAPVSRGARFGPASDVLLTAFVADAASLAGPLRDGVQAVTSLRSEGARWGLIALELGVRSQALVAAIDTIGTEQLALADRSVETGAGGAGDGTGGGLDGGPDGSDTGSSTGSGPSDTPSGGGDDPGNRRPPGNDPGPGPGPDPDPDPPGPVPPPDPEDPQGTVEEVVSEVADVLVDEDGDDEGLLPDIPLPNAEQLLPQVEDLPLPNVDQLLPGGRKHNR